MSVINTVRPLVLLFVSSFILMISHGLSGILLPTRLAADGVSVQSVGFILAMFSVGFLLGAILGKKVLKRIGLVRTFAMCGSLAAGAILVMGLSSEALAWAVMRAVMGFSIACAIATLDTWFNSVSTEDNRGKVLALNQIVILTATTVGQFGLMLASPTEQTLFIISGILFGLSISPVIFISHFEPEIEESRSIKLQEIYSISPLGFITCLFCGVLFSTVINMLPVYAIEKMSAGLQLSLFMGAATAGGIILQFPVGFLSDRFERRKVILACCAVLAMATGGLYYAMENALFYLSLFAVAMTMGLIACLYPLSISETFDRTNRSQMVPVLSGLLCLYAIGSIIGPYLSSIVMQWFASPAIIVFLFAVEIGLIGFTLYRISVRDALPVEEQESFVMYTSASINEELDPRTEYHLQSLYLEEALLEIDSLKQGEVAEVIVYINSLLSLYPEWVTPLTEKAAQQEDIDLVVLYRSLTLANPDLSPLIARAIAASSNDKLTELVQWLINKEPENTMEVLVALSEEEEQAQTVVLENLAENAPEKVVEFSQEMTTSVIEHAENMRPADREELDVIETLSEFINNAADAVPEQVEQVVEAVEQTIDETSELDIEMLSVEFIDSESTEHLRGAVEKG